MENITRENIIRDISDVNLTFKVSGRRALFTDPITKLGGEKMTYMVPTYSSIIGVCESIYWKPTFIWVVDALRVMNKIETEAVGQRPIGFSGRNTLSIYTYLRDVSYKVRAHLEWNEQRPELVDDRDIGKHTVMAKNAIKKGGRLDVFLGTRECQAEIEPCKFNEGTGYYDNDNIQNFGLMFHDIGYPDDSENREKITRLSSVVMEKGIIKYKRPEECEYQRVIDTEPESTRRTFILGKNMQSVDLLEKEAF